MAREIGWNETKIRFFAVESTQNDQNCVSEDWERVGRGSRRLFPFRKRSLPFLTVDAIIGNQAFCHGRCNICSGLSHNKVTNTFLNSLRKNKV